MKITLQDVRDAVGGNNAKYACIYSHFFDGDKVQGWLVNQGIEHAAERDDIIDELTEWFTREMPKYKHAKLSFEVYIWKMFSNTLLNYRERKAKLEFRFDDLSGVVVNFHIGFVEAVDSTIDIEILSQQFRGKTKTVFEAMAQGYVRQDMPQIQLTKKDWDQERVVIRKRLAQSGYAS